jgi:uncharacterized membrane protein YdjX (TVP38/TMEM64 family)
MRRTAVLVAIVAGTVILSKLLIEDVLGLSLEGRARAWMDGAGAGGAAAVVGLLTADVFLPIPSSLIMILSGAAFGVGWGAVFAFIGSVGGEWLGFEIVRRYGTRMASRFIGDEDEIARLNTLLVRHGAAAVAMTRALPVVMETMSVVAGLSAMSRRSFLVASALGTAPIVVVYAYAGALSRDTGSLVPAVVMLVAVAGCGWIWYRAKFAR